MATIALVSGRASGANAVVNTSALLTDKGHSPTFFDQTAVTAINLVAFDIIYVLTPDLDDATFEGFIRDYMRVDNIPVMVVGHDGGAVDATDSLTTRLGIAESVERVGDPNAGVVDAVLPAGFEDNQITAGMDPEFPIPLRPTTDEGFSIPFGNKHKGTTLLTQADGAVIMFQAEATDTDFTDTSQTLGARFVFFGVSGDDGHAWGSAGLITAAINWLGAAGSFDFEISENTFGITIGQTLDRLVTYQDTTIDWQETTPGGTSIQGQDSQDELQSFTNITLGGEISGGFVMSDPISGDVFFRWNLTAVAADTPEVRAANFILEGEIPALVQLGAPTAPEHDPTVLAKDDWFTGGLVVFISGDNVGLAMEVRQWTNSNRELALLLPMTFDINVMDRFTVYTGCRKTLEDCVNRFDNVINFRGEPYVPGNDQLFRTPDAPIG